MTPLLQAHLIIGTLTIIFAIVFGLKIALLGNEEISLKKARGADLKSRTDMAYQVDRSKSQLDYEASGPALDDAIRTLGLPLAPPPKVASR